MIKFYLETTIPNRQFENIKTRYEGELSDRDEIIKLAKDDLKKLYGCVKENDVYILGPVVSNKSKEGQTSIINGIKWIFIHGKWQLEEKK